MALVGVFGFILFTSYWLELLIPCGEIQVDHALLGLTLVIPAVFGPASQARVHANTRKGVRTGFAAPAALTTRDPSTPSPDSGSAFQL